MQFEQFHSIESFYNIRKMVNHYPHLIFSSISYKGKIKLNGTNLGIRVNDSICVQSKSRDISIIHDNMGSARFVEQNKEHFLNIAKNIGPYIVYGEWCGPGIQKNVAINKIPDKIFAIFEILLFDENGDYKRIIEPDIIKSYGFETTNIYILPWQTEEYFVDFFDIFSCQTFVDNINKIVSKCEHSDPWVKLNFNVDGIGEGFVFYPVSGNFTANYTDIMFKAKGEKHKTIKNGKNSTSVEIPKANGIDDFVKMVITEARLEQGVSIACNNQFDITKTGKFLQWINTDVFKETVDELIESNLTWNDVKKYINGTAKDWYISKCKQIR